MRLLRVVEVELGGADGRHDNVEDAELASGERADHHATGAEANSAQVPQADLADDVAHAAEHAARAARAALVHLGEHRVGRVGDDGGDHAGDHAGQQRDGEVGALGRLLGLGAHHAVDGLGGRALHGELGHRVRDLLEEDRDESRVEGADEAVLGHEAGGGAAERGGVVGLGDEADAAGLVGAEEDVGDEPVATIYLKIVPFPFLSSISLPLHYFDRNLIESTPRNRERIVVLS